MKECVYAVCRGIRWGKSSCYTLMNEMFANTSRKSPANGNTFGPKIRVNPIVSNPSLQVQIWEQNKKGTERRHKNGRENESCKKTLWR